MTKAVVRSMTKRQMIDLQHICLYFVMENEWKNTLVYNPLFFNIVMIKMRFPNFLSTFFYDNIERILYCKKHLEKQPLHIEF